MHSCSCQKCQRSISNLYVEKPFDDLYLPIRKETSFLIDAFEEVCQLSSMRVIRGSLHAILST